MDYDRLMVMADGKVGEMDSPHRLLQNADGYLTRLVRSVGLSAEKKLRDMAAAAAAAAAAEGVKQTKRE